MNELCDTQYIAYELANEKYAIKICEVFEIIKYQTITTVYNSKAYLEGVINLRGKIIPVVNLHKRIGMKNYIPTKTTRIIVIQSREDMVGIIVDKVCQVIKFSEIQPPPEMMSGIDGSFFEGLGITDEGVVSLLKIDKLLYEG